MIKLDDVLIIHSALIDMYGGADGIRDISLLKSTINRPFSTFDSNDLYPTIFEKCSALIESILINHPFIDGNKRVGFSLIILMLKKEGYVINASEEEIYEFVIGIASSKIGIEEIIIWLRNNTVSIK